MDLGKAFVQIMPSAKGISANIQKIIEPEAIKAGQSAGKNIAKSMADSLGKAGSTLTKHITTPALTAASAVAGVVGALGFKRLVGMDNAQAKLKGLGIEGQQLEKVMESAKNAVLGTTHTLADGAYVAAGALAAGVKEGAELERYIKIIGDTAVAAEAPMSEVAQIFNRIQSAGKIARTELDMLNYRLPGFENSLMEHVGAASQDAFDEMVRAGKVSSADVLDTIEELAGGMSEAFAGTWMGIGKNILSNIGMIGEGLLEGVFDSSKEEMGKFLQTLRESESLKEWAKDFGETLRVAFETVVEVVKNVISWWSNLDGETKKMIGIFLGVAVALGPVLVGISKVISVVTSLVSGFGMLKAAAGVVAGAIGGISAPVLIVAGAIAGLIALFVGLYKHNEDFRNLVQTAWTTIQETISTVIQSVSDFVMEIFGGLVEWWNENNELIMETVSVLWETMKENITKVLDIIVPIVKQAWDVIKIATETVWNIIKTVISTVVNTVLGIIKTVMQLITGDWKGAWETIKQTAQTVWNGIKTVISTYFSGIWSIIQSILGNIKSRFSNIFNSLKGIVTTAFNNVRSAVSDGIKNAYNTLINFVSRFKDAGRRIVQSIADGIRGAIGTVTRAISNVAQTIRDFLPFSPPERGPMIERNEKSRKNAKKAVEFIENLTNQNIFEVEGLVL